VLDAALQAFERNFATNFYGVLASSRAFAPVIEKNGGGAIVNMHTLLALASMPGLGVYNASKAAAWSLTQSMRAGLAGRGVAVHGVFPGPVDTDMLEGMPMPKARPDDVAEAVVQGISRGEEDIFPAAAVEKRLRTIRAGTVRALEEIVAKRPNGLPPGTSTRALALFFSATLQGMSAQARDGASREELEAVARAALRAWPA
jgi:short-subunit dehydrogenase